MNTRWRLSVLLLVDIAIIWFSIYISYLLRFGSTIPDMYYTQMLVYGLGSTLFCGGSLYYFRLYHRVWQYASIGEIIGIVKAVAVGGILSWFIPILLLQEMVSIAIVIWTLETMLILMGAVRFGWRVFRSNRNREHGDKLRVVIIGAGDCGVLIARELTNRAFTDWELLGFIDDAPEKQKMHILGVPVLGSRNEIHRIAETFNIEQFIIAMPSAPKREISNFINLALATGAKVKMIPAINDLITGKISVKAIRDVEVEDLLGRDPIVSDLQGIANYVQGKVVLVTGAGGSIGSELCRQISTFTPDTLLLLGHGENSIYLIEMELRTKFPWLHIETIIADIQDRERMEQVFNRFRPQVVFHAAAHKHVPLMERNPTEAVKNNIFGTKNVADCADKYGAERFVMISSDKAVNPTSIMGATKRIAEMYVQSLDAISKTKFVAVRFGNVLGSRGSVIPRFKEQIIRGGPVTVTHPDMIRYFMTIPEAVQLVIQAGSFAKGGEIFVLDMGKPVKIVALAEDLIRLSGYEPYTEIPIEFTGIREGEKLFEELLTSEETVDSTQHDRIYIGKPTDINRAHLELEFKRLEKIILDDQGSVRDVIENLVPMYENVS
ncbi:polysaccharide biosynthesis protein [Paenibacillus sp. GCM10012307]|uniref:Polysaccharide biosynthesis protein n=1 Tax=Paenibacillus roseus TaxID=2798579 RepID=A0A934J388_9BACL|nr:nucleoside-diphosphate sugar epimerase/dehydratase [Paenibacillus roseus]MBJ6361980.1 polysaccharide biosynthesis protein [Paenibacillus roseus]